MSATPASLPFSPFPSPFLPFPPLAALTGRSGRRPEAVNATTNATTQPPTYPTPLPRPLLISSPNIFVRADYVRADALGWGWGLGLLH